MLTSMEKNLKYRYNITKSIINRKEAYRMKKDVLALTNPMDEEELEQVLGGGSGVLYTISHECKMNTWQFMFTCCS